LLCAAIVVEGHRAQRPCRRGIVTALVERRFAGQIARVSGVDPYVPLGDAPTTVLVGEDDIERGVRRAAVVVSWRAGCPAARAARRRARR
jgi:hypothetical protein